VAGVKLRKAAWTYLDPNGDGIVSLADLDAWILRECNTIMGELGETVWKRYRPSYIHAFDDARAIGRGGKDDYLSKPEFRVCSVLLCFYAAVVDCFFSVDVRILPGEWRAAYVLFRDGTLDGNGLAALVHPSDGVGTDEAADKIFKEMDSDGRGMATMAEWCKYFRKAEEDARTPVGLLFTGSRKEGRHHAAPPGLHRSTALPPGPGRSSPKGTGSVCGMASRALALFRKHFAPYGEKTPRGKSLRKAAWHRLCPDDGGAVRLAELERWVSLELERKHPGGVGRRIWCRLRPCCMHAFESARAVDGNGDTLSTREFRLCVRYLCIYSGMVDSHCSVAGDNRNGGGNGTDDGHCVSLKEWEAAFPHFRNGTGGYNFAAFADLADNSTAGDIFRKMDAGAQGSIALFEWCHYLVAAEIGRGTEDGADLSLGGPVTKN